ncbi:heterogeneous nuclear ribonucleoproteins A1 homolog [Zerene cesonia]|uniref:heterogeneous nuclear ribonucleoproteins A1 homolog n=1 Tax=Zerene cesonia TaxID=33412 RepID=UPI0018E59E73|nr:heterogeneous nuclear ribonucleoproteins A1 homolog [Zerene cesonia]
MAARDTFYQYEILMFYTLVAVCKCASLPIDTKSSKTQDITNLDLKTASSSYSRQYYDWAGSYPGGYDYTISGNGIVGNGHDYDSKAGGYNPVRENGYPYDINNPSYIGQDYGFQRGDNFGGYSNNIGGYGGYGGNGGNGGLSSYYGYNNPYYNEANHLGYGYYNKKLGFGNIYSSGVTPNLVTGYRGYSRR